MKKRAALPTLTTCSAPGGHQFHRSSHVVARGVSPGHSGEWTSGVGVRNGGGLDGGGRKNAEGATEPDDFAESSGFHTIIPGCRNSRGQLTIFPSRLGRASRDNSDLEEKTASLSIIISI